MRELDPELELSLNAFGVDPSDPDLEYRASLRLINWRVGAECFYTPRRMSGTGQKSSQAAGKYLDMWKCTQLATNRMWPNSHYICDS